MLLVLKSIDAALDFQSYVNVAAIDVEKEILACKQTGFNYLFIVTWSKA